MLIPGVEPDLIAYKTIVLTDTLYEQKSLILVSFFFMHKKFAIRYNIPPDLGLEPRAS